MNIILEILILFIIFEEIRKYKNNIKSTYTSMYILKFYIFFENSFEGKILEIKIYDFYISYFMYFSL